MACAALTVLARAGAFFSREMKMPRRLVILVVLAAAFAAASCTTGPSPSGSSPAPATTAPVAPLVAEDVEATISQLERDWVEAIVKKTRPTRSAARPEFNEPARRSTCTKAMASTISPRAYVVRR